jgi:uncharacterized C2H2 Zn-finger protein
LETRGYPRGSTLQECQPHPPPSPPPAFAHRRDVSSQQTYLHPPQLYLSSSINASGVGTMGSKQEHHPASFLSNASFFGNYSQEAMSTFNPTPGGWPRGAPADMHPLGSNPQAFASSMEPMSALGAKSAPHPNITSAAHANQSPYSDPISPSGAYMVQDSFHSFNVLNPAAYPGTGLPGASPLAASYSPGQLTAMQGLPTPLPTPQLSPVIRPMGYPERKGSHSARPTSGSFSSIDLPAQGNPNFETYMVHPTLPSSVGGSTAHPHGMEANGPASVFSSTGSSSSTHSAQFRTHGEQSGGTASWSFPVDPPCLSPLSPISPSHDGFSTPTLVPALQDHHGTAPLEAQLDSSAARETSPRPAGSNKRRKLPLIPTHVPNMGPIELYATVEIQNDELIFTCKSCQKVFKRIYNLKSHLRTHSNERPHACPVCGKAFLRKADMYRYVGSAVLMPSRHTVAGR